MMIRSDVKLEVSHEPYECQHLDDHGRVEGSHLSRWWTVTADGNEVLSVSECFLKWHLNLTGPAGQFPGDETLFVTGHSDFDPAPPPDFSEGRREFRVVARGVAVSSCTLGQREAQEQEIR